MGTENLTEEDSKQEIWNSYNKVLYDAIKADKNLGIEDDIESLSTWKKWYWVKLNWFINIWYITKLEITKLKYLWLAEKQIVENIDDYKVLLDILRWGIISFTEIQSIINVSNRNIGKIKWFLRQIIDLDRLDNKDKKNIMREFLK